MSHSTTATGDPSLSSGILLSPHDASRSFSVATGIAHNFVLNSFCAQVLDIADAHFHCDSAVLLPELPDPAARSAPALAAIRSVYEHAAAHPTQKLMIIGHADRSGSADYNLELSRLRADGVVALLLGDRTGWAAVCRKKHKIEDYQQILTWVAARLGWACSPGRCDGVLGPRTRAAVQGFQRRYNHDRSDALPAQRAAIPDDGTVCEQTWSAFFDVYMQALQLALGVDRDALAAKQRRLQFLDPRKRVGCGESHPLTANAIANRESRVDRRVEIIFLDPAEAPKLDCHPNDTACLPELCQLYRPVFFHLEPVPIQPLAPPERVLRLVLQDEHGKLLANEPYSLEIDGAAASTLGALTTSRGVVEHNLSPGAQYAIVRVRGHTWNLQLGAIPPSSIETGARVRLANLGLIHAPNAPSPDGFRFALRTFQARAGIEQSGEHDEATAHRLANEHLV